MPLLSPADQEKLRESFDEMTSPVRVLFFTQTLDCDPCVQTRQILDELPPLSDKIAIEEVNFILEKEKAAQYGIDRVPAMALLSTDAAGATRDSRIRFLGTPAGYEFVSLVQALLLVGGHDSQLTPENPAGGQPRTRNGLRQRAHHRLCGGSDGISRSCAQVPHHGRPQDGRQRSDRDPRRHPAGRFHRPGSRSVL